MASKQLIESLKGLGVNSLEAEVYCKLLKNNGVTAYRLAKSLNKATANVYKSVKVLARLGGITIKHSNKELCYAVEPKLFLASLNSAFQERCAQASELLEQDQHNVIEEGVYQIDSASLAIQQAKNSINSAQHTIVIDAFPNILKILKPNLEGAVQRKIVISLQTYDDIKIKGVNVAKTFGADKAMEFWRTEQLNLVIDGRECLICLFNSDLTKVNQAMWSRDLYLACVLHAGLSREHFFHQLQSYAENVNLPDELVELINNQSRFVLNTILEQSELETLLQRNLPDKEQFIDLLK